MNPGSPLAAPGIGDERARMPAAAHALVPAAAHALANAPADGLACAVAHARARVRGLRAVLATATIVLSAACPAFADGASTTGADAGSKDSRLGFGASLGYAHAFQNVRHPDGIDATEPQMLVIAGQVRYELGAWRALEGSALDIVIEPQLMANFAPSTGFGGALTGGFRYRMLERARWRPFLIGVAGVGGTDFDLDWQDDGFQFWLEAGVGVRRPIDDRLALSLETRFHHISNAGMHPPNIGIDSILVLVGIDF
jgi:hypothetical protein